MAGVDTEGTYVLTCAACAGLMSCVHSMHRQGGTIDISHNSKRAHKWPCFYFDPANDGAPLPALAVHHKHFLSTPQLCQVRSLIVWACCIGMHLAAHNQQRTCLQHWETMWRFATKASPDSD